MEYKQAVRGLYMVTGTLLVIPVAGQGYFYGIISIPMCVQYVIQIIYSYYNSIKILNGILKKAAQAYK